MSDFLVLIPNHLLRNEDYVMTFTTTVIREDGLCLLPTVICYYLFYSVIWFIRASPHISYLHRRRLL